MSSLRLVLLTSSLALWVNLEYPALYNKKNYSKGERVIDSRYCENRAGSVLAAEDGRELDTASTVTTACSRVVLINSCYFTHVFYEILHLHASINMNQSNSMKCKITDQ